MKPKLTVTYIKTMGGYNHSHILMHPGANIYVATDSEEEFKNMIKKRLSDYDIEFEKDKYGFLLM